MGHPAPTGTSEPAERDMNPIPEPDELREAECNAQGLYGLPEAFAGIGEAAPAVDARAPMQASSGEPGRETPQYRARPQR